MADKSFASKIWKGIATTMAFTLASTVPGAEVKPVVYAAPVTTNTIPKKVINFSDLKSSHWAYSSVQWGVEKGLIVGYVDGTYKPKEQIIEAEFVTILTRYVKDITVEEQVKGGHWAQHFYNALKPYNLPLKGDTNKVAKQTALSRGQIAQIIAAKNGFNLDERQAIYYMYENDISYGMIDGKLSFESYGKDQAVNREQIPAFFQRLEGAGITKFLGKPSTVKPDQIGGINGVPKDPTIITDAMFDKMEKDKIPPKGNVGTMENPVTITNKDQPLASWHAAAKANPEIANKMIGVVDGIVTPVDMNVTRSDPSQGHILSTSLSSLESRSGFHDEKLFFEVIDKYWTGTVLDANQIKHIKDLHSKYFNKGFGPGDMYVVKGSKYDTIVSGSKNSVNVNIYKKGWADATGIEIRK